MCVCKYGISHVRKDTNDRLFIAFRSVVKYSRLNDRLYGKSTVHDELMKQERMSMVTSLKVTRAENITDLGQAQIIYLAAGKSASLDDILKATEGKPIMIICEREGLHKKGAGFSFIVTENSTLRFDINNTEL